MTMKGILTDNITASVSGIADAVELDLLQIDYPKASGAIIAMLLNALVIIVLVTKQ